MTPEHRIEILKLSKPAADNPDMALWLARAKELEAYVSGAGQPETAQPKPAPLTLPEARNTRQSPGPAYRK